MTDDGRTIAYDTVGDPGAPPMLLIQGLSAQLIGWRAEFCRALADRGFLVIRFDNRDAGLSQKYPGQHYTLADMADDSAALLDALDIDATHLVGQSMGGMIAQELAIRSPRRVASLCLMYSSPNTDAIRSERDHDEVSSRPTQLTRDQAIKYYVYDESYCGSRDYPFDTEWIRELGGRMWDRCYYPEGVIRQLEAVRASPDRTSRLTGLDTPTVVIHGDADRLIDTSGGRALAAAIPRASLVIYPGMGHELPRALWDDIANDVASNAGKPAEAKTNNPL